MIVEELTTILLLKSKFLFKFLAFFLFNCVDCVVLFVSCEVIVLSLYVLCRAIC